MANIQVTEITIEWTYTPADYFEAPLSIDGKNYSLTIDDGQVTARVDPGRYPEINQVTDQIGIELKQVFMGAQVIAHKPFALSKPKTDIRTVEGRRIHNLRFHVAAVSLTNDLDGVLMDSEGNVVFDPRQERIERKREMAQLAAKYIPTDLVVESLFGSYQSAVQDSANELVHLYEIRDAIGKAFGGEASAQQELGITKTKWDRLKKFANVRPLKQGRHRGKNPGALRDATPDELREAREIAQQLIYSYLLYLENERGDP